MHEYHYICIIFYEDQIVRITVIMALNLRFRALMLEECWAADWEFRLIFKYLI